MDTKRKWSDDKQVLHSHDSLRKQLSSSIADHESAEVALLHIMEKYDFHLSHLQEILTEQGLDVSFSNIKYEDIASFVGLEPWHEFSDVKTFELHRARIPDTLFKDVLQDMDIMQMQYGPPNVHKTEEARSRFLAPIFNRLVSMFGFVFRNLPESMIQGRITKQGRIEHFFRAFGGISILFIEEEKFKIVNEDGRLNAIAQVIAESDACDWNNTQSNFSVPIYGILSDGESFEFFKFDGSTKPYSFYRGCFPGDPIPLQRGLRLGDFTLADNALPFMRDLRTICETTFYVMLLAYISSLKAFWGRSEMKSKKAGQPIQSLDKWEAAIESANETLEKCGDAEAKRGAGDYQNAKAIALEGMEALKTSVDSVPVPFAYRRRLIMSDWDDEKASQM